MCANRGRANPIGGQDFGAAVDAQVGDEDAQGLGLIGVARGDDAGELVGDGVECGRVRCCGRVCGEFACEWLVLVLERVQTRVEGG